MKTKEGIQDLNSFILWAQQKKEIDSTREVKKPHRNDSDTAVQVVDPILITFAQFLRTNSQALYWEMNRPKNGHFDLYDDHSESVDREGIDELRLDLVGVSHSILVPFGVRALSSISRNPQTSQRVVNYMIDQYFTPEEVAA